MSNRGDGIVGRSSLLGLIVFAYLWAAEHDRRVDVEEQLQQIERASGHSCEWREGQRFVSSLGWDGSEWARWCGYYQTVIESVKFTWEKVR